MFEYFVAYMLFLVFLKSPLFSCLNPFLSLKCDNKKQGMGKE